MAGDDPDDAPDDADDGGFAEDAGLADDTGGFADEVPSDPPSDEGTLDSGGSELDYAAEAPDEDEYEAGSLGGQDDLSGEFQAEAGDDASYGFESVRASSTFEGDAMGAELAEDLGSDEHDDYALSPENAASASHLDYGEEASGGGLEDDYETSGAPEPGEDVGFAEDAGSDASSGFSSSAFAAVDDEAVEASGFADVQDEEPAEASGFADEQPAEASGFADVQDEEPAEASGFADVQDEEPAEASGFADVQDEEPAATGFSAEDDEPPPPSPARPQPAPRPSAPPADDSRKSGSVPKNALDAIFARAAEIKRKR